MRILNEDCRLKINQIDKIENLAAKYDIKNNNQETAIRTDKLLDEYKEEKIISNVIEYQSIVGELLYIARMTRPDVQLAVNQLSRFTIKPKKPHFKYALQVIQYLYNTGKLNLVFKKSSPSTENIHLKVYSDSDFANDTIERKSFSGYCVLIDNMLISWSSNKQSLVA